MAWRIYHGMSIITLAQAKEYVQISHSAQDTVLQMMIDGAEDFLAQWMGVDFASAGRSEDLDGGGAYLLPAHRPLTALTSVTDLLGNAAMDAAFVGTGRIVRADSSGIPLYRGEALPPYLGRTDSWLLSDAVRWPQGLKRFRAVYTAGFAAVPAAVKLAVLQMIQRAYQRRGGEVSSGAAGVSFSWGELFTSDIIQQVKPHSCRRVLSI